MLMKKLEKKENLKGGNGIVMFEHLLGPAEMDGMCRLYAKTTLMPGSSIGWHVHEGDAESYYILSGKGLYINNDKEEIEVVPGDVTYTGDGEGHSLINNGDEKLVFMALIINGEKRL